MIKGVVRLANGTQSFFEVEDVAVTEGQVRLFKVIEFEDEIIDRPAATKMWMMFPFESVISLEITEYDGRPFSE